MTQANALLLIQDSRFNKQIPGKVYEYLRTQKPILLKADITGETFKLTSKFEAVYYGNNVSELKNAIKCLIDDVGIGIVFSIERELAQYNRESKARSLQKTLLEQLK
jgi:hypothetical protein